MSRKRGITKIKVGFSIDINTYDEFVSLCDDNLTNKSMLVDRLLKKFIEKEKNKKVKNE